MPRETTCPGDIVQILNPTVQIKYSLRTLNKKIWLKDCTPEQRGQMGRPTLRQMFILVTQQNNKETLRKQEVVNKIFQLF